MLQPAAPTKELELRLGSGLLQGVGGPGVAAKSETLSLKFRRLCAGWRRSSSAGGLDGEMRLAIVERGPHVGAAGKGAAPCQFVSPVAATLSI